MCMFRKAVEKHYSSLKILHPAGLETSQQAATSAKHHAPAIASCPWSMDALKIHDSGRVSMEAKFLSSH